MSFCSKVAWLKSATVKNNKLIHLYFLKIPFKFSKKAFLISPSKSAWLFLLISQPLLTYVCNIYVGLHRKLCSLLWKKKQECQNVIT